MSIESRKKSHVELCVGSEVRFKEKTTGFERYEFAYNALPEIDFADVDISTVFLGKQLSMPLMISSMTGGYGDATRINTQLAELCSSNGLAIGVGSMRQAITSTEFHESFRTVRTHAPRSVVAANIGAPEIAGTPDMNGIRIILDLIEADALIVHLNPLQELLQPEGTPTYRGILAGIEYLVRHTGVPVIVKEVGAGLSADVARRLLDAGVRILDVAGAGGTSWAGVELLRNTDAKPLQPLWDMGIPTAECLEQLRPLKSVTQFTLIASGGINDGFMIAKSLALGADLCASARPLIKILIEGGEQALDKIIRDWELQLRAALFLTGTQSIRSCSLSMIRRL